VASCDFLICGAGIAGASLAFELAPHAAVIIAEQEDAPGYHTTGRSAAMYIESYGGGPVRALTAASRAFFDAPPAGFADYPLLTPRGCLTIANNDQRAALERTGRELTAGRTEFREVGGDEARAIVPALAPGVVASAILEPNAADIDTNALHAGFLKLARRRGAELRSGARVESIEGMAPNWRARLGGGEIIEAKVIVDAAGAWGDVVANLAGVRTVGLGPKRRTAILIEPPPGLETADWPVVIDAEERFYFKPQSGLLLASPADETASAPLDAAPEELDIAICVDRIQAVLDFQVRRVVRAWAGLRTFAPDRIPVIGYDPRVAGFFWLVGQGGFGMQTSPAAARLAAALALGHPVPADLAHLDLESFSPARLDPN
jgi:D-arginine dehydrogenase